MRDRGFCRVEEASSAGACRLRLLAVLCQPSLHLRGLLFLRSDDVCRQAGAIRDRFRIGAQPWPCRSPLDDAESSSERNPRPACLSASRACRSSWSSSRPQTPCPRAEVAGFIVMPFMSSAPALCAVEKNADMTRAAKNVDWFIMRSLAEENRRVANSLRPLRLRPARSPDAAGNSAILEHWRPRSPTKAPSPPRPRLATG